MVTFNYVTRMNRVKRLVKCQRNMYVQIMAMLCMQSVSVGPKGVKVICSNELYLLRELLCIRIV